MNSPPESECSPAWRGLEGAKEGIGQRHVGGALGVTGDRVRSTPKVTPVTPWLSMASIDDIVHKKPETFGASGFSVQQ